MRPITKLVVHCTATPDAMDVGFKEVDQWHLARGWNSPSGVHCGYHFLIRRNGVVEVGRMANEKGAHVEGANSDSIGICLVGTHEYKPAQIKSLKRIIDALQEMYPSSKVYEHRQFPSAKIQQKTCPNLSIGDVLGIQLGTI